MRSLPHQKREKCRCIFSFITVFILHVTEGKKNRISEELGICTTNGISPVYFACKHLTYVCAISLHSDSITFHLIQPKMKIEQIYGIPKLKLPLSRAFNILQAFMFRNYDMHTIYDRRYTCNTGIEKGTEPNRHQTYMSILHSRMAMRTTFIVAERWL